MEIKELRGEKLNMPGAENVTHKFPTSIRSSEKYVYVVLKKASAKPMGTHL